MDTPHPRTLFDKVWDAHVVQSLADGWDLLLTPTVAEPPLPLAEFANSPDNPTAPMRRGLAGLAQAGAR